MLSVAALWLLLCLPGYALVRWLWPAALAGGPLSGIALGYLASFTLLTPVSVVAYAWRLPLAVLSTAIVVCVVLGLADLLRDARRSLRWPRPSVAPRLRYAAALPLVAPRRRYAAALPSAIGVVAFALVTNNAISGLAIGSALYGDARYHVARVRMLVDHGFNSWDPIDAGHRIDSIYHGNLYHALMAAIAQLASVQPADAWTFSLFFARLAVSASVYHLAWVVLGKRSLAWIAAVTFAMSAGSNWLLTVPHNFSVYALVTLGLAFAVQLLRNQDGVRPALAFAATCVVLPQFHGLYYMFLALAVGPVLLLRLAYVQLRRLPDRRALVLAMLGLGLGSLWLADQVMQRMPMAAEPEAAKESTPASSEESSQASEQESAQQAPVRRSHKHRRRARKPHGFVQLAGGQLQIDPTPLVDPRQAPAQVLLALVIGVLSRRRREVLALAACLVVPLAVMFVPALSAAALQLASRGWVVARLMGLFSGLHPALVPGTFLLVLWERFSPIATRVPLRLQPVMRATLPLVGLCAAIGVVYLVDGDDAYWPQENYWNRPRAAETQAVLDRLATQRAFLRVYVDPGALVAAKPGQWYELMMTCNCYPLALVHGRDNHGMTDMPERRAAVETLFGLDASLDERLRILRHYGVRHIFVDRAFEDDRRQLRHLYAPLTLDVGKSDHSALLKLSLDPE